MNCTYYIKGIVHVASRDADTQRFLYDVLQRDMQYKGLVWLGLNDVSREGHFTWVDGKHIHTDRPAGRQA